MKVKENSELNLYKNVDITTGVQIAFKSKKNQAAYFAKKSGYKASKFYYIRRNGHIKVEIPIGNAMECNYLSFKNPDFENKVFYGKIINVEYVSNKVTEITYAVDYFQTYMFDVNYEWGTIEREHLSESDYQKSLSNPYDPSIFEFQTEENIHVNKEMEEIYDALGQTGKDFSVAVHPPLNDDMTSLEANSCIILQLATFNESAFSSEALNKFKNNFDAYITPEGDIYTYNDTALVPGFYKTGTKKANIGRGYTLYMQYKGFYYDQLWQRTERTLQDALDWLTSQALNQNIIGIYQCNKNVWDTYVDPTGGTGEGFAPVYPRSYKVTNKKLLLSPFQYIRVYNNEGDCKEYKYELFKNIANKVVDERYGVPIAEFQYLALFDGAPMVSLVPVGYRREGTNPDERIDIHQIPQVGYSTDSYLAFIANQYSMNLAQRTNSVTEKMGSGLDEVAAGFRGDTGAAHSIDEIGTKRGAGRDLADLFGENFFTGLQSLAGSSRNVAGMFSGDLGKTATSIGQLPVYNLRGEVAEWRSGGNVVSSEMLAPAKGAFVADDYHPGSTNGTLGYYLKNARYSPGTYTFIRVKIRDEFLAVFDRYFSGYGYTSGRLGTPRICAYINGVEGSDPHFSDFLGKKVTYVKTNNMHVTHTLASVSENIESMFNSGCQFLKGEDL